MRRLLSTLLVLWVVLAVVIVMAPAGQASFHFTNITEVFASGDTQFVELQMYSGGQNFVGGVEVAVFDASGQEIDSFAFASNMPAGTSQSYMLVATSAAEAQFDKAADLLIDPVIVPAAGKVCFQSTFDVVDCVAWGNYTGPAGTGDPDAAFGTPFDAANGLPATMSMTRDTSGGSNANGIDGADDTNDSASDFDAATPSPNNNTGAQPSPSPTPTPSPSPCSPARAQVLAPVDGKTYRASKAKVFSGNVTCNASLVEVALQKKMRSGKCLWWGGDGFFADPCSAKAFQPAVGVDTWTFDLGQRLPSSIGTKIKHYTVYARATSALTDAVESDFDRGSNASRFEVR